MKRSFLLILLLACSPLVAAAEPALDVEQEAAYPDDQETRLSMLTLAVASASRATAFFEIYDGLPARSGVQPHAEIADAVTALERAVVIVPEAAGEALSAETAGDLPGAEICERGRKMDEELSPHLDMLFNLTGS